jgi:uncharacterized protein YbjT (DUF2867 family)
VKIVVTGGTGTVGSHLVRALSGRGASITVPTRSEEKIESLPAGVEGCIADLTSPSTVRRIFRGADAAFLLNAMSMSEVQEGLVALSAALEAGVCRVVYLSVRDADIVPLAPHFAAKVAVERALRSTDAEWTILRPNSFYQNDLFLRDALLEHGAYPQPIGDVGVSRVDARDIAEAAAAALMDDGHTGETYDISGPDVWTGETTAAEWSRALGREIRYGGDDLDAWEAQTRAFMPDWMRYDLRIMFRHFQEAGLRSTAEADERLQALIGHRPRSFEAFARETAETWMA